MAVVPYDPDHYLAPGAGATDSLAPLFKVLRRWRWRIIGGGSIIGLLVGVVVFLTPREYQAAATFIPQEPASSTGKGSLGAIAEQFGLSGVAGSALSSGDNSPAFYGMLLKSSELLHDVVMTQYSAPHYQRPFGGDLVAWLEIKVPDRHEAELRAIKRLRKSIMTVGVDRTTGVVAFTVETEDPDISLQIARRVLSLINTFNLERRQTAAGSEREFTERRSAEALETLKKAEVDLADFLERNRSYAQSALLSTQIAGLRRRVDIAQEVYLSLVEQFETAKVAAVRNTPVITVVDNPEGLVERVQKYTLLKAAVGAIFGALLIAVVALIVERKRDRAKRDAENDAEGRATGWPAAAGQSAPASSAPRAASVARHGD
jgi:uncharacterized protein involved in exopolysaccharide biosynthesis